MAVEGQRYRENPSMEKQQDERKKDSPAESAAAAWGTWEELLLAYAVNRYGTKSWDSIASELRKRSSAPILLTPHHCRQKYQELRRRFSGSDVGEDEDGSETATGAIPWLEELRNLRVAELQRQLQNYDLSIASLQMKVKRLTEENEKKSDLGQKTDEIEIKNEEDEDEDNKNGREPKKDRAEPVVSGEVPLRGGEESDRDENQSVNGSNGNLETGADKSENENENENEGSPVRTGNDKPEAGAVLPVREDDSCNIRPDGKEPPKVEPDGEASESPGSMAESKSVEGTTKENSDVQSSASKSRKERRDKVRRGSSRLDERETDDLSKDSIPVRSLPLVDFLHKLQKLGSAVFEPRLDRQEKLRYKKLIRQPIDIEILQTRLKSGWYSDGNDKFFRDLLLLVNNTCIFFPKDSPEAVAANEIRKLVLKEMTAKRKPKTDPKATEKQSSSKPATLPSKRTSEPPDSLLLKPKLAGPMIVCRKRSSIAAKASGSSSGGRKEQSTDLKNSDKLSEENQGTTKRTRETFPVVQKRNGKNVRANSTSETQSNQDRGKAASPSETSDSKSERRKRRPTEAEEKKQSAAKFLNRMKRSSSSSNNEPLLNTLKSAGGGSSENDSRSGGGERKSGGNGNRSSDSKKDQAAKRNSGGRQPKEQSSPAKRAVGRPPKRAAAPPPMSAALGKRNRESAETETPTASASASASKQTKKRSRR